MTERDLVTVRASVHLPGLAPGEVVDVDADDPEIAHLLASSYLEPHVDPDDQPPADELQDALPDVPTDDPVEDTPETDDAAQGV